MCFISAKLRLHLRVQNILNSSDLHLAEVTEQVIVQNASWPPYGYIATVTGRGALSYSRDTITHNVPDTQSRVSQPYPCMPTASSSLFFPCHSRPIQCLADFFQG